MDMEKLFEHLTAKMDADRKADQEKAEADREERRVGQEKLLKEMKAWREEMAAMRNKWVNDNHNETMACQEIEARPEEEKEPTPVNTKPEVAQQDEFPAENAEVMLVREPKKKRRRDQKLAAERRRQKPKISTQEKCGTQKRLAVARREKSHRAAVAWQNDKRSGKMSHRARVARHTRHICAPNTAHRAGVVRCKENAIRKGCSKPSAVEEIRSGQVFGRRRWPKLEPAKPSGRP
jgi:hypothetical protein